jgi:hypothetical protein
MKTEAVLTPSELEILEESQNDPSIFTDYFFRPYGDDQGFIFDHNFDPEGAWQVDVHEAAQKDIVVIGGFGTGKTLGIGMSACVWAAVTADFKFLNAAPKAWQSKLMYDLILLNARNTRFEDLIWEKPRKPHPRIVIRYRIGDKLYESSLEFMSADKNAEGILSWEGDWLNVDESGLLDNLEEVIINLGSRLRGTVRGRERLGRFSMTSNSWDNFYLWYYFDLALAEPENFLSLVVASRHNRNVTEEQLKRMIARIPKEERSRFLEGTRPEGRGRFFDRQSIYACEDIIDGPFVEEQVEAERKWFVYEKAHGLGVVDYQRPPVKGRLYMFFGDPGIGAPPQRNAPVWMGWDVTDFPNQPARMVYFWWGNGGGRIGPFVDRMLDFQELFKPLFVGIDSTGPQKNMAYLINEYLFRERFGQDEELTPGYEGPLGRVGGVGGLDFSGSKKAMYLQAGRLLMESQLFRWPKEISGMRSQLSNYDPEKDRGSSAKIAQDIVAAFAMSAHGIRVWFHVDPKELLAEAAANLESLVDDNRRLPTTARTRRSARARPSEHVSV